MIRKILITGGAGFIGSHLADELINNGYQVRALDNLSEQVHGANMKRPAYLHPEVELMVGDIRDKKVVRAALKDVDAIYHFAAMVGVGQSMYAINDYTDVNNRGTAVLLEELIKHPVRKLVVASSMSIYGEGLYRDHTGDVQNGMLRNGEQLKAGQWELHNSSGEVLSPVATPETKAPDLASIYALSKFDQEKMCLLAGQAYNIPTVALRFFNVYGTRQALSNPYTGVLAIFASRYLNNKAPLIFEDGQQKRDFISVKDVTRACRLALEKSAAMNIAINVGSGNNYTILEIAERLAFVLNKKHLSPQISGKHRVGDIRHCFADISLARKILGFEPQVSFDKGLKELALWLANQKAADNVIQAREELESRGLTV